MNFKTKIWLIFELLYKEKTTKYKVYYLYKNIFIAKCEIGL